MWAVQAKREAAVAPKKLRGYAAALPPEAYGVLLAAPAEFSLKARDAFFAECSAKGYQEIHLWGRRDLEDMLFQPKNDHLLFAYFGISLQIRKRTATTAIKGKLAIRRQIQRALEKDQLVLLRDAFEDGYPYLRGDDKIERHDRGRWLPFRAEGCFHDGLRVVVFRRRAFIDDDGIHWDFAPTCDDAKLTRHEDPWADRNSNWPDWECTRIDQIWWALPEQNRAWLTVHQTIPYEKVVAVDPDGDELFDHPHIYTTAWAGGRPPLTDGQWVTLRTISGFGGRQIEDEPANRVEKFPRTPMTPEELETFKSERERSIAPDSEPPPTRRR